jgi:Septum formation topological specificity factor MinE.
METSGKAAIFRLKKVLLNDKTLPSGLLGALRADLAEVLTSYFEYDSAEMRIDLDLDSQGKYNLKISAPVERVKSVKMI